MKCASRSCIADIIPFSTEAISLHSCPLKVPVVDAEQAKNSYKYNKCTKHGKRRLSHGEEREEKIKNKWEMNESKKRCSGQAVI